MTARSLEQHTTRSWKLLGDNQNLHHLALLNLCRRMWGCPVVQQQPVVDRPGQSWGMYWPANLLASAATGAPVMVEMHVLAYQTWSRTALALGMYYVKGNETVRQSHGPINADVPGPAFLFRC